jgi:flagellar assembly protein FliH
LPEAYEEAEDEYDSEESEHRAKEPEPEPKTDPLEAARIMSEEMISIARANAELIISRAQTEAEAIEAQANAEAQELFEAAKKDGYDAGYDEGIRAADATRREADTVLADAKRKREETFEALEGDIVELVAEATKKIVYSTYETDRSTVVYLIKRALSDATVIENVKIHVSKDDYDDVVERKDEIAASVSGTGEDFEFVKNLSLGKGDCVIETAYGNIDCGLDGKYERLLKNLHLVYEGKRI